MGQDVEVREDREGATPVVEIEGEIDVATKDTVQRSLDAHLEAGEVMILADLRKVTFLDSTGLGVLASTLRRCREAGGDLRIVADTPRVLQLFSITGLDQTFLIAETPAAALALG